MFIPEFSGIQHIGHLVVHLPYGHQVAEILMGQLIIVYSDEVSLNRNLFKQIRFQGLVYHKALTFGDQKQGPQMGMHMNFNTNFPMIFNYLLNIPRSIDTNCLMQSQCVNRL